MDNYCPFSISPRRVPLEPARPQGRGAQAASCLSWCGDGSLRRRSLGLGRTSGGDPAALQTLSQARPSGGDVLGGVEVGVALMAAGGASEQVAGTPIPGGAVPAGGAGAAGVGRVDNPGTTSSFFRFDAHPVPDPAQRRVLRACGSTPAWRPRWCPGSPWCPGLIGSCSSGSGLRGRRHRSEATSVRAVLASPVVRPLASHVGRP